MSSDYMSVELYEYHEGVGRTVLLSVKSKPIEQGYLALNSFFVKERKRISRHSDRLFLSVSVWSGEGEHHVKHITIKDKPLMSALRDLESLKDVYRKMW